MTEIVDLDEARRAQVEAFLNGPCERCGHAISAHSGYAREEWDRIHAGTMSLFDVQENWSPMPCSICLAEGRRCNPMDA